jgi:hypothetical protein
MEMIQSIRFYFVNGFYGCIIKINSFQTGLLGLMELLSNLVVLSTYTIVYLSKENPNGTVEKQVDIPAKRVSCGLPFRGVIEPFLLGGTGTAKDGCCAPTVIQKKQIAGPLIFFPMYMQKAKFFFVKPLVLLCCPRKNSRRRKHRSGQIDCLQCHTFT